MAWFTHGKRGRWSWVSVLGMTLSLAIAGCGTASGAATASPTTTTPPTPIPTIAPTPTPQPTLVDPLTSNKNDWAIIPGRCAFANGGYVVTGGICERHTLFADDGAISVDAKATAGDSTYVYSLLWRYANSQNLYIFGVTPGGNWVFGVIANNKPSVLDSGTNSAIHQGLNLTNTLKVDFRGSHFVFFVNDVKVGEDNSTALSNTFGLVGVTSGTNGSAIFNNFAYYA